MKSGQWEERSLITPQRWLAWASRLDELAESDMIEDELKGMARSSAEMIRTFEREWVFDTEDEIQQLEGGRGSYLSPIKALSPLFRLT